MLTNVLADSAQTKTSAGLFLESLKNKTAKQHRALESQKLLAAIMSPEVTRLQYYGYLLLMQQVEWTYEEKVLPFVQCLFAGELYSRASRLIQQDLEACCHTPSGETIMPAFEIPTIAISTPFALGFTYVMEGSKLGGRVIYKHINKTLKLSLDNGARFLADNGGDTGRRWKDFLTTLSTFVIENKQEEEVIEGARLAFTSIFDYFESNSKGYGV